MIDFQQKNDLICSTLVFTEGKNKIINLTIRENLNTTRLNLKFTDSYKK